MQEQYVCKGLLETHSRAEITSGGTTDCSSHFIALLCDPLLTSCGRNITSQKYWALMIIIKESKFFYSDLKVKHTLYTVHFTRVHCFHCCHGFDEMMRSCGYLIHAAVFRHVSKLLFMLIIDSLTPATPSSESNLSPSPKKPTPAHTPGDVASPFESNSLDGLPPSSPPESQPLSFPDVSAKHSSILLNITKRAGLSQ